MIVKATKTGILKNNIPEKQYALWDNDNYRGSIFGHTALQEGTDVHIYTDGVLIAIITYSRLE